MLRQLNVTINEHTLLITLRDTGTADAIFAAVPFESTAQTWGDEVYFSAPVSHQILEEDANDIVQAGELAYWVEGDCIAIGFGPTPISQGNEIRLAARTNLWADTNYDVTALKNVQSGDVIKVTTT